MKNTMKLLSLFIAMVMVLSVFTACNNGGTEDTDESEATVNTDGETGTETETETDSAETATLKMATNAYFKPYEYYEGEVIVGIDAEIAAAVAEKLNMKLEIVDMQFDSIISSVMSGACDFGMAGMTVTEERLENVDFTSSYAKGKQVVIVKEGSAITSVDDLFAEGAAQKIGVQLGTTGDSYATDDFGAERITTYENGSVAVLALLAGDIDCVIIDNAPAEALVEANEGLTILESAYADEDYAICVMKGNSELLDKLNAAIVELTEDGTIDAILAKYIK